MGIPPSMGQCILCGAVLTGENTRLEHAIPKCIGGRIRSRRVTCTDCNNSSGSKLDRYLYSCYWSIINEPLREFVPANVRSGGSTWAVIRYRGTGFWMRMPLAPRRSAGRGYVATAPDGGKLIVGADNAAVTRTAEGIARAKVGDGSGRLEEAGSHFPISREAREAHHPSSVSVRCAALKAGVLALAALDAGRHGVDFKLRTFDAVRDTIRAVNDARPGDGVQVQVPRLSRSKIGVSLGIHQERLPELLGLRRSAGNPCTDFEHFIVLSGSGVGRSLELFVVLFSAHVFAFRLTNDWSGGDIVLVAVNGVLRCSDGPFLERLADGPLDLTPKSAGVVVGSQPMDALVHQLYARAWAYRCRNSDGDRKEMLDQIKRCGGVGAAASEALRGLFCPDGREDDHVRRQSARVEAEAAGRGLAALPAEEQAREALSLVAQGIEVLAGRGVFPSRYRDE